jgi:hypothetical protein
MRTRRRLVLASVLVAIGVLITWHGAKAQTTGSAGVTLGRALVYHPNAFSKR